MLTYRNFLNGSCTAATQWQKRLLDRSASPAAAVLLKHKDRFPSLIVVPKGQCVTIIVLLILIMKTM